jgi:bacterioferritin-associated ferredoxin
MVKAKTVKSLLAGTLKRDLKEDKYFLCMNKSCNVAYYKNSCDQIYLQEDLKVPIWFKEGASPKYICYCSRVTEKEIISAIINENATTVKELVEATGAMKSCNCELNHPTGRCCSTQMKEVLGRYKNRKEKG